MSIGGPSTLGTLLIQRLDAALGVTLSQQANIVSGARPDAVTQPDNPNRVDPAQNDTQRHPRESVDKASTQTRQGQQTIDRARLDARMAELLGVRTTPNTAATQSAPTTLGYAAKTILALLAGYPGTSTAVQGKAPLINGNTNAGLNTAPTGAGAAARTGTPTAGNQDSNSTTTNAPNLAMGRLANAATAGASAAGPLSGATLTGVVSQLAQALSQAVQTSGLFYESHLNNLAFGKQALGQLLLEPQAQIGRSASPSAQAPAANGDTAAAAAARPAGEMAATAGQRSDTAQPSAATTQPLATAGQTPTIDGLDPQTNQIVRQQLDVLANQTFAWRGEAWPNAPMQWEISRRQPSPEEEGQSAAADHWATRINISLPGLGEVQARLTLAGQQLVMQVIAPASAPLLNEHADALRARLLDQGLQLSQISIAEQAPDGGSPPKEAL